MHKDTFLSLIAEVFFIIIYVVNELQILVNGCTIIWIMIMWSELYFLRFYYIAAEIPVMKPGYHIKHVGENATFVCMPDNVKKWAYVKHKTIISQVFLDSSLKDFNYYETEDRIKMYRHLLMNLPDNAIAKGNTLNIHNIKQKNDGLYICLTQYKRRYKQALTVAVIGDLAIKSGTTLIHFLL